VAAAAAVWQLASRSHYRQLLIQADVVTHLVNLVNTAHTQLVTALTSGHPQQQEQEEEEAEGSSDPSPAAAAVEAGQVPATTIAAAAAGGGGGGSGVRQSRLATSSGAGGAEQEEEDGDADSTPHSSNNQQQQLGEQECLVLLSAALGALGVLSVDAAARGALMAVPGVELLLVQVACLSGSPTTPSSSNSDAAGAGKDANNSSSSGLRAVWPEACALDNLPPVNHVSDQGFDHGNQQLCAGVRPRPAAGLPEMHLCYSAPPIFD
jgi:hypothetical protein